MPIDVQFYNHEKVFLTCYCMVERFLLLLLFCLADLRILNILNAAH